MGLRSCDPLQPGGRKIRLWKRYHCLPLPWCHCGGLNENVPHRLKSLNIQSPGGGALWRGTRHCWRKDVTRVGLWEFIALLDLHYILSACIWVWRRDYPDSHSGCPICCSLSCLPTLMHSDPSGTLTQTKVFLSWVAFGHGTLSVQLYKPTPWSWLITRKSKELSQAVGQAGRMQALRWTDAVLTFRGILLDVWWENRCWEMRYLLQDHIDYCW